MMGKKKKYYLWVDTETAGLIYDENGYERDADLMELSAILTDDNFKPIFKKNWVLKYNDSMKDKMPEDIFKLHTDNGLIGDMKKSKITSKNIDDELTELLIKNTRKNSVIMLAGNNIHYDYEVIRRHLFNVYKMLYFRLLDVSSIKELLLAIDPKTVYNAQNKKEYKHRALKDIEESIMEIKDYWEMIVDVVNSYR